MNEEGKLLLMLIKALEDAAKGEKIANFSMPYEVTLWFIENKDKVE